MAKLRSLFRSIPHADRLHRVISQMIDQLPTPVSRLAVRAVGKKELVPSDELMEAQRAGLRWLLQEQPGGIGDYVEFGVYQGTSLACFHHVSRELGLAQMRLFGFDSFAGLPPQAELEDNGVWHTGQYRCSLNYTRAYLDTAGVDWERVKLIKGWFSETAHPHMAADYGIHHASFVMIDCDLYSSTVEALRFIAPLLRQRAVLIFDDWAVDGLDTANLGQKKAFEEFLSANPEWVVDPMPPYHSAARVFTLQREPR